MTETSHPEPGEGMTAEARDQLMRLRVRMGFLSAEQAVPERIGDRYSIVRKLGHGGMGVVFLARDTKFDAAKSEDAEVALKLVESGQDDFHARLRREAQALLSLRNASNVVHVYDLGRHGNATYFTMKYVAGGTLREWQAGRSLDSLLGAYLQAARGLIAAHDRGIVHRDFKPENVLIEGDDVMVADFGIAAAIAATVDVESDEPTPNPRATVGGTLPYMAPEQFAGEPADARTDQFAFCVALWEATTGCLPWEWLRREQQLEALGRPPRTNRWIPGWLRRVLRRGMAADRKDRFTDMRTLCAAIERGRRRRSLVMRTFGIAGTLSLAVWIGHRIAVNAESEPCDDFVGQIETHWPASVQLDGELESRAKSLVDGWRDHARRLCIDDVAPDRTLPERRCMESWLGAFDAVLVSLGEASGLEPIEDLSPLPSGYCELHRAIDLDSKVMTAVVSARTASMIGNTELAEDESLRALARANELAGDREHTAELAEAHAVRVEVLARAGRLSEARQEFELAEQHADLSSAEVMRDLDTFWAKTLASLDLEGAERILGRAEGLAFGTDPESLRGAQLLEARALVASGAESVRLHHEAAAIFDELGRPLAAARSRQNAGAALQEDGRFDEAAAEYQQVIAQLGDPLHRRAGALLHARYGLAEVILAQYHVSEGENGSERSLAALAQLEPVIEHGTPELRLDALGLTVEVLAEMKQDAEVPEHADRVLLELERGSTLDASVRAQAEVRVALGLLMVRDPRGEPMTNGLLARRSEPEIEAWLPSIVATWLDWLVEERRCEEVDATLVRFADVELDLENESYWRNCAQRSNTH
ncbi:protein kinase domain-containing protein [Nannocystaceae bacterium ST9]